MSKSGTTYKLLQETLVQPGCPLCRQGRAAGRRHLDALLFESVNDPDIRAKLALALGFCARHHREMLTFQGERLGVAIIERALLVEAVARLDGRGEGSRPGVSQRWFRRRPAPVVAGADCPACVAEVEAEQRLLDVLLSHLGDDDLITPLRQAGGLCWSHLQQALAQAAGNGAARTLVDIHRQTWTDLAGHLAEFIRKRDYRFRHEPITPDENEAIERAMAVLGGKGAAPETSSRG